MARGLMEEGMEVIYTGLRRTPEQVVDADVIGVGILSGAHSRAKVRQQGVGGSPPEHG